MTAKVKIRKNNSKKVLEALAGDRLGRAVMAGAFILETAVKVSIAAASHSGRIYGKHQASAPGETPAVDTGVYINSINTQLVSSSDASAYAEVGTGDERGEWLEFGTSRMAARPHFRPAYDKKEQGIRISIGYWLKQKIEQAAQ
jgi:hypothetical protein